MNRFAELLDRLTYEPARNAKLRLMTDYFRSTPDPERGWALAALTGALTFPHAKPGLIRSLIAERTDPVLFELSYDYVGDLSETIALMWPTSSLSSPARGGGGEQSEPVGVSAAAFEQASPLHHASPTPTLRVGVLFSKDGGQRPPMPLPRFAGAENKGNFRSLSSSKLCRRSARPSCRRGLRAGSMRSTKPADGRSSSSSPAACASAFRRGSPRLRSRRSAPPMRRTSSCCGPVWRRLMSSFSRGLKGAPKNRRAAIRCRFGRRCWRMRSTNRTSPRSTPPTSWPSGSGTASACRRSRRRATATSSGGSIRAPARISPKAFPI